MTSPPPEIVELSADTLMRCAQLLFNEWSDAVGALDRIKASTDDGSPDWALFHASNLTAARTLVETTRKRSDEINGQEAVRRLLRQQMGL